MVLTYSGLRHLALCCLQTNVLPHWLVTNTVQCISLHHNTSGYEGIISDILTVLISDKPPFQQHWNDTSTHNPFTVLMNCLMFKAVTYVYVYMHIYNLNRNTCDQEKLMLKIFLTYLQLLIMNISFVSMICISYCQTCFSKGSFSCC